MGFTLSPGIPASSAGRPISRPSADELVAARRTPARSARPRGGSRRYTSTPPVEERPDPRRELVELLRRSTAARGSGDSGTGASASQSFTRTAGATSTPSQLSSPAGRARARRLRRAEQQREQAVVARALDDDPHRPEPRRRAGAPAPRTCASERTRAAASSARSGSRRAPARPALELLLRRQPVAGRVELHRVGSRARVEGEELLVREARPGRTRAARRDTTSPTCRRRAQPLPSGRRV